MTRVEGKQNVVCNVSDTASSIRRCIDRFLEVLIVLDIWYHRAILGALIIDVYLEGLVSNCGRENQERLSPKRTSLVAAAGRPLIPPVAKASSHRWAMVWTS